MLRNGALAPDFTLASSEGAPVRFGELRQGKPTLLLFFRGAFCPTSQRDLISYANAYGRIKSVGAELVAVSVEPPATHQELQVRLGLGFPLLSDPDMNVSDQFGVYHSDDEGGPQPHGEPALYILDIDGKIAFSQVQSGPKGAATPAEMALILLYMSQNDGRY